MQSTLLTAKQKSQFKSKLRKYRMMYLFILPSFLIVFLFSYIPYIGILIGFKDQMNMARYGSNPVQAFLQAGWTFSHFTAIFQSPELVNALLNTLVISGLRILILFPLNILVAVFLTEIKSKAAARVILIVTCLPHFLSWSVVIAFFTNILDPTNGAVNNLAVALGLKPVYYMGEPGLFKGLVTFIAGWKTIGWNSIIFYAAISALDKSFYEAAKIDGATRLQQIWFLTLPLIMGTIALMFVISITYLMDAGFDQIQIMINPYVREKGEIFGTLIYRYMNSTDANYTQATALGLFNGTIALVLMLSGNFLVKKTMKQSIW